MIRIACLAVLAVLAGGCIDKQHATNGAIRFLNASPDAPRISLLVDDVVKAAGYDYGAGSPFIAFGADTYQVKINELLPTAANPNTQTIFTKDLDLGVDAEWSYIVVGEDAANSLEVLQIPTTTTGVAISMVQLQFVHAAVGEPAFDAYVTAPDAVIAASTPFASGLAYKAWTPQKTVTGGNVKIVLTAPGDPSTVLFESNTLFLTLETSQLIAVVPNLGIDADVRPFALVFLSGFGSGTVLNKDSQSGFRVVNASPGTYQLDTFLNASSVDNTARQVCDPATTEETTFLELCAIPFTSVGTYNTIGPGTYELKVQETGNAAVTAASFVSTLVAGASSTTILMGLIPDTATTTGISLHTDISGRRIATAAQLRLVDVSQAADKAIAGDPATDRLEIYLTAPGASLADEEPDYTGLRFGSDTGYVSELAGNYQLTLAIADTETPDALPQVLLTQEIALADSGIYTLLIADSVGGVMPPQYLSIDDDPTPP